MQSYFKTGAFSEKDKDNTSSDIHGYVQSTTI